MAFKLGNKTLPGVATGGNINKKHKFKIVRRDLEPGVVAEATSAKEIVIDSDVEAGSKLYREAVAHEALHAKEMEEGRLDYGDDWIRDGNKTYHRKNGKIKYNGKWHKEGSSVFPWEKRAMKAEKNA